MTPAPSNIILIGMPGSGKSAIGLFLAQLISMDFVDTDSLIREATGRSLQDIVDTDGPTTFRKIEEEILLKLDRHNHVIATGGSAVYSSAAMAHLKKDGVIVFLDVDLATLTSRVHDYATRGLAKRPDQTLQDLFDERLGLYRKYADVVVNCVGLRQEEICAAILRGLKRNG
jgi:shikimate kinase